MRHLQNAQSQRNSRLDEIERASYKYLENKVLLSTEWKSFIIVRYIKDIG